MKLQFECGTDETAKIMTDITNRTNLRLTPDGSMDKVKKLLHSPGSRRKLTNSRKTFNVPLDEMVRRAPHGSNVPFIVSKICEYIHSKGLDQEGIFRVSGNQREVEKMKNNFDLYGDCQIEDSDDIMAVAGLLKLFLREMPDSTIPAHLTKHFVNLQEAYLNDTTTCIQNLKKAVGDLPPENYNLLKYIIGFLVLVSSNEKVNKMSPMALAIVFGPNLFRYFVKLSQLAVGNMISLESNEEMKGSLNNKRRCGQGIVGLKDQGTINQIVYKFIQYYSTLFKSENEESPDWQRKKQKTPPPRPPPPKLQVVDVNVRPVPSPRKIRQEQYDCSQYQDQEDWDQSEESNSLTHGRGSIPSPRFSDDEMIAGRASPFILDSDGGYSMIESPQPSARTSEAVEKVIAQTVTEQLFGDEERSMFQDSLDFSRDFNGDDLGASIDLSHSHDLKKSLSDEDLPGLGVKERIKQFSESVVHDPNNRTQGPTSSGYDGGLLITQAARFTGKHKNDQNQNSMQRLSSNDDEHEFETVKRNSATLTNIKKPSGPPNRRSPSRKLRNSWDEKDLEGDVQQLLQDTNPAGGELETITAPSGVKQAGYNNLKPRVAFLELTNSASVNQVPSETSPNRSPSNGRKPFIPPLDLSTLHEHVDSTDAIPANKGQSVSYQRAKTQLNGMDGQEHHALISPRTNKLVKRKADEPDLDDLEAQLSPSASHTGSSVPFNTDFPPSPPVGQDHYKKHSTGSTDDEYTVKLRQYTKKIHGLKKKIRHFEESFERENGYKPSHADKNDKPEVKKWMSDIAKVKRDIKKLKEDAEIGSRSRHGSGTSSSGERRDPPDLPPTMEQTLDSILQRLQDKRQEVQRPEDVVLMSREQIQDEKLSVQKALLHFENIHGRPRTKEEKDLMRPLYDRYRTIKRLIAKPLSPRDKAELQTVPEDQPFELDSADKHFGEPVRVPVADLSDQEEEEERGNGLGTMDFAVTRDFSILPDPARPSSTEKRNGHSPKVKRKLELDDEMESNVLEANLHEMSVSELQDELIKSRGEKKQLRRLLRNFEDEFFQKNERKVQREDRVPLQTEYQGYKRVKARLKLLEALLSKFNQSVHV